MLQFNTMTTRTVLFTFALVLSCTTATRAEDGFLTPQENLWLKSRNNTIVVYPEKNAPPFSYQTPSGMIQGMSIDYIELIGEKIGAKIEYLTPRSRGQILDDMQHGKGDVALTITPTIPEETDLLFTESYISVASVIVVRKDYPKSSGLSLVDFNGKRVGAVDGSGLQHYVRKNYPRVVLEAVTDDEVNLQQIVLGEYDAGVMDVASLSYYLSKQVLSSVKIVGNSGFDREPAFAVPKDKAILQGILEKGLSQISAEDRAILADKWITLPGEVKEDGSFFEKLRQNLGLVSLIISFFIGIAGIFYLIAYRRQHQFRFMSRRKEVKQLEHQVDDLTNAKEEVVDELHRIEEMEAEIKRKLEETKKYP